jgi:hypothetical protein
VEGVVLHAKADVHQNSAAWEGGGGMCIRQHCMRYGQECVHHVSTHCMRKGHESVRCVSIRVGLCLHVDGHRASACKGKALLALGRRRRFAPVTSCACRRRPQGRRWARRRSPQGRGTRSGKRGDGGPKGSGQPCVLQTTVKSFDAGWLCQHYPSRFPPTMTAAGAAQPPVCCSL